MCIFEKMEYDLHSGLGSRVVTENDIVSTSTEIFTLPEKEVALIDGRTSLYRPLHINDTGPYEFIIPGKSTQYLQMSSIRMYVKAKLTLTNGAEFDDTKKIALCNLPGSSLFSQIEVELNQKLIPLLTNTNAATKAYLETLCSYGEDARNSHLRSCGFVLDTDGEFDNFANQVPARYPKGAANLDDEGANQKFIPGSKYNNGHGLRRELVKGSRVFELEFPIQSDFLQCMRLLPPMITLGLKLTRNSDLYLLQSPEEGTAYKIHFIDMEINARHVSLEQKIYDRHMQRWATELAVFPIGRTDIQKFTFAPSLSVASIPNLYRGALPKHLLVCILDSANYEGSLATNPFNFKNGGCTHAYVRYNGEQIPNPRYEPDFSGNNFVKMYRGFYDQIGIGMSDEGTAITPDMFKGGSMLIPFDFTPDKCNRFHLHPSEQGVIDFEMGFKTALTTPLTVICVATFDTLIGIDKQGNVQVQPAL